jgi:2-polyprenyl-3-methyl-5-hydroxy-6-metoxy-1,4-benzoquinol methylase
MSTDRRAALRACQSFAGTSIGTRAFLAARVALLPLAALDPYLRELRGRVVSIGCGHGVLERYVADINPTVDVTGVELDEDRVVVAARSQADAPRVKIVQGDATAPLAGADYDAALAIDVLHHVPHEHQAAVASSLFAGLRPGGECVVKDLDVQPRWKYHWNRLHDRFVNKATVYNLGPSDMAALFESAGFVAEGSRRIDRALGPYAHYVLRLRKP